MGSYSYSHPVKDKPPSAISHLGRVVKTLSPDFGLTAREIFGQAFRPHDNFDCCKVTLGTAQARDYVEKDWQYKRPNRYKLTAKGKEIKLALERK